MAANESPMLRRQPRRLFRRFSEDFIYEEKELSSLLRKAAIPGILSFCVFLAAFGV